MAPSIEPAPQTPRLLVLETSGRVGQVALARGDELLGTRRLDEARRHARDLAPQIAALLKEQNWRPRDLDAVIVSRGPGSYTGLRIGIMSAKTLAYAVGCAVIGIDTFAAVALQAIPEVKTIDVIADAQQGRVYLQRFSCAPGALPSPLMPLQITTLAAWLADRPHDAWATGPGLHAYAKEVVEHALHQQYWDPRAESVLRLGADRLARGERDDLLILEPLYLRPSGAEEKWTAQGKS